MQLTTDFDVDYELYAYDGDDEKDMKVVPTSSSTSWLKYIFYLFFSK